MKKMNAWILMTLMAGFLTGCAGLRTQDLPVHDEVLIYELPYDLVYLRSMEAIEKTHDWELEETEKEKGILRARNTNYSLWTDEDLRQATILVKRISRAETSVALAAYSQRVTGGDELMKNIDRFVSAEL